jgi:ribA/ribD-fused uncharacterized protein
MIDDFNDEYGFLSNFYLCEVDWEGKRYPSTEHAYQAAKTLDPKEKEKVRKAASPSRAKRLGKKVTLRKDWESVKVDVMGDILRIKFAKGTPLADRLIATGTEQLVEGNTWGDKYWGKIKRGGQWVGKNKLGELLMLIRWELQL